MKIDASQLSTETASVSRRLSYRAWLTRAWPGLIVAFWLLYVFIHPFDDDEFQHANFAWLISCGQKPFIDFFEHHFPLYHALIAPIYRLGAGPWVLFALRLVNAGFGLATLRVGWLTARRLGATKAGSTAAVILLASVPMFIAKMVEVRPEPAAVFLLTLAVYWLLDPNLDENYRLVDFRVGLAAGLAVALSFKYVFAGTGLGLTSLILRPRRYGLGFILGALAGPTLMFLLLLANGVLPEAIDSVLLQSLEWKYGFSPAGYLVEAFTTAGPLLVFGLLGIVYRLADGRETQFKNGLALALAGAGALVGIWLVPVPHRQTFLPLFPPLAIAAAVLLQGIDRIPARQPWGKLAAVFFMLGALLPASRGISRNLAYSVWEDVRTMQIVESLEPGRQPIFEGRRLMFYHPHIGRHACMHDEILAMLDLDQYADEVVAGLEEAGFPPVIMDYRVQNMPDRILRFIDRHYVPLGKSDIYLPGFVVDRSQLAGREVQLEIALAGIYRLDWTGSQIVVNGKTVVPGELLEVGGDGKVVQIRAEGFVEELTFIRLERSL